MRSKIKKRNRLLKQVNLTVCLVLTVSLCGCWGNRDKDKYKVSGWQGRSSSGFSRANRRSASRSVPFENVMLGSSRSKSAFYQADPVGTSVDLHRLVGARMESGVYRVVVGDILEFHMPSVLWTLVDGYIDVMGTVEPYVCRVSERGSISIPLTGELHVLGMTLAQIEEQIVKLYCPKYMNTPPSVVGSIRKYNTMKLSIVGAVERPGSYRTRSDEMTVVSLIMKAGGILNKGAAVIRIYRGGVRSGAEPIILPVKGLNIPFADVALQDGDIVEIEALNPQVFTVIGLVNRKGSFPYPPGVKYTLLQALAFAGGVNDIAAPENARIYRQDAEGNIVTSTFKLKGSRPVNASGIIVRPGDVIAVEHTFSTRARVLLAQVLRLSAGLNTTATYQVGGAGTGQ